MERTHLDFCQNSFGGYLACTSVATVIAAAMADNDDVRQYVYNDSSRLRFLTEFASGLWRETSKKITDESVGDVISKHSFFKNGEVYDTEGWAGRFGSNSDDRRIELSDFINEIEKEYKRKGSLGVVFTDNVVSFACGLVNSAWVLYDSHAPASCCERLSKENATLQNIEVMITRHFVKKNGIFDATVFTRKQ